MDTLKSFANKITGQDKYHNNLLGESLSDLLRKATAKTLLTPDEEVNQQVVYTIQQEMAGGKDGREIVTLLKKRLRTDNPQKQYLGVLLFAKVLPECQNVLGLYQEELLQEVAKVMAKPARPETDAGKTARHAARELLRQYGRAGTTAWRAAHREVYGRPVAGGSGFPPAAPVPYSYNTTNNAATAEYAAAQAAAQAGGRLNVEKQSLKEEIHLLIDKARSNTELLSDMLVNAAHAKGSEAEFEQELISDLVHEVTELRGLFDAYLEQLQAFEGPDMETLMVQALEASDLLDGAIALQKDVKSNQTAAATGGADAPSGSVAPAPAPAPVADLISLDDLADGLAASTIAAPTTHSVDPFAASTFVQPSSPPAAAGVAVPDGQAPAGQPQLKSAFENMFAAAPTGAGTYSALSAAAPPPGAPFAPQQPGHYSAAPHPGYGAPGASSPYGPPPPLPQFASGSPYGPAGYGPPGYGPPGYGQPAGYGQVAPPYGQPPPAPAFGQPPHMQPFSSAPPPAAPTAASNPFSPAIYASEDRNSGMGFPMPPPGLLGPNMNQSNPFGPRPAPAPAPAAPAPAPQQPSGGQGFSSLDQEWNMFFADRTGGPAPGAPTPANHQQVNADFDALVGKTGTAR